MAALQLCMRAGLIACLLAGCGEDEKRRAEREREEKGRAIRLSKWKAERDAEAKLMADPATAAQALESRLAAWLTVKDGLIAVQGNTTAWSSGEIVVSGRWPRHVMPATTPWFVRCDEGGLEVVLGNWIDRGEPMFNAELTRTKLSDEQCRTLVPVVGQKMLSLTRGD